MTTTEDRFKAAIKATRKRGVKVRTNVQQCCRSCVGWEKLGFKTEELSDITPFVWTYGGQGSALTWVRGEAQYRDNTWGSRGQRYDTVWFNHGNGGAEVLAEEMRAQGFELDWNGSEGMCVGVKVDERVPELEADDPLRMSLH